MNVKQKPLKVKKLKIEEQSVRKDSKKISKIIN